MGVFEDPLWNEDEISEEVFADELFEDFVCDEDESEEELDWDDPDSED